MSYCKIGEKVIVNYSFNGVQQPKIELIGAIGITSGKEDNSNTNYNPNGYHISFYSPNNYKTSEGVITDYQITDTGNGGDYKYSIKTRGCDGVWSDGGNIRIETIVIDASIHCPKPLPDSGNCFIKISKDGKQIYKAIGTCPCTFTVACGNSCPDGYCKIDCDAYPGFCCINESVIKDLTNKLSS